MMRFRRNFGLEVQNKTVDKNLMFMIYVSVICRDKTNKGPVRISISFLLKYSAFNHREIIKYLRMKSGVESYTLPSYVYTMKDQS